MHAFSPPAAALCVCRRRFSLCGPDPLCCALCFFTFSLFYLFSLINYRTVFLRLCCLSENSKACKRWTSGDYSTKSDTQPLNILFFLAGSVIRGIFFFFFVLTLNCLFCSERKKKLERHCERAYQFLPHQLLFIHMQLSMYMQWLSRCHVGTANRKSQSWSPAGAAALCHWRVA